MPFYDEISQYDPQRLEAEILAKTPADVERSLAAGQIRLEEFKALLSPAAADYLEPLAKRAHRLTVQRFGKTILM
jgi:2-iminoacetate synthase